MSMAFPLVRLEQIIGGADVATRIEALLPAGVRPRQLLARTLCATKRSAISPVQRAEMRGGISGSDG